VKTLTIRVNVRLDINGESAAWCRS